MRPLFRAAGMFSAAALIFCFASSIALVIAEEISTTTGKVSNEDSLTLLNFLATEDSDIDEEWTRLIASEFGEDIAENADKSSITEAAATKTAAKGKDEIDPEAETEALLNGEEAVDAKATDNNTKANDKTENNLPEAENGKDKNKDEDNDEGDDDGADDDDAYASFEIEVSSGDYDDDTGDSATSIDAKDHAPGMFHGFLDVIWKMWSYLKTSKRDEKAKNDAAANSTTAKDDAKSTDSANTVATSTDTAKPVEPITEEEAKTKEPKSKDNEEKTAPQQLEAEKKEEKEKEAALKAAATTEKSAPKVAADAEKPKHNGVNGIDSSEEWMKEFYSAQPYKWKDSSSSDDDDDDNDDDETTTTAAAPAGKTSAEASKKATVMAAVASRFSHLELIKSVAIATLGVACVIAAALLLSRSRLLKKKTARSGDVSPMA